MTTRRDQAQLDRTSRPGPLSRGGISAMKPRYEGFTGTVHLATLLLAYLAG